MSITCQKIEFQEFSGIFHTVKEVNCIAGLVRSDGHPAKKLRRQQRRKKNDKKYSNEYGNLHT